MLNKLVLVLALASIIGLSAVVAVAMIPVHVQASAGQSDSQGGVGGSGSANTGGASGSNGGTGGKACHCNLDPALGYDCPRCHQPR